MSESMKGQVAVVTGGGSGIGCGVCLDLARKGVKVMIFDVNDEGAKKTLHLIKEEGCYGEPYQVDVTDKKAVDAAIDQVYARHGRIDILVSNAGIATPPVFTVDTLDDNWEKHIKIHLHAAFYLTKACGKIMKKQQYGRIVVTSSVAGVYGLTGYIGYSTGKTGLVGFTYTTAKEFGPYGITVNAIQSGLLRTPLAEGALNAREDQFGKETPVPRIGEAADVANAVSFLCKPESGFITGVILRVDGGYILQSGMDMMCMEACRMQDA